MASPITKPTLQVQLGDDRTEGNCPAANHTVSDYQAGLGWAGLALGRTV